MRELQREMKRIQRAASQEYIRERVEGKRREIRRETEAEIREALRGIGIGSREVQS